jgi:hypothetical protein
VVLDAPAEGDGMRSSEMQAAMDSVNARPCECVSCGQCGGTGNVFFAWDDLDELETCEECRGGGIAELCDRCRELDELYAIEEEADERGRLRYER